MTSKGQITLPKRVRDALGLEPGAQVSFEVQSGQVILRKQIPEPALQRWRGYLRSHLGDWSTDAVMQELRDA